MRSFDGMHFENVIGVSDHDRLTGEEFAANVVDCNKPMVPGDQVVIGEKRYHYHGEDSLGRSVFTLVGRPITEALF